MASVLLVVNAAIHIAQIIGKTYFYSRYQNRGCHGILNDTNSYLFAPGLSTQVFKNDKANK